MDETEWLTGHDAQRMLAHVPPTAATARRLRLVACACVRLVWDNLQDACCRHAVEVAERFAEGRATAEELRQANRSAFAATRGWDLEASLSHPARTAGRAATMTSDGDVASSVRRTLQMTAISAAPWVYDAEGACVSRGEAGAIAAHQLLQAAVIRDVFGNPFRPVRLDPDWLAWGHGVVGHLAETIHAERRWQDLPVLADALEDAGCDAADLLRHLRGPGPHVRGCWAVGLLLGRE